MNKHAFQRATALAGSLAVAVTLLAGCGDNDDNCEAVSSGSLGTVMVASTVRPRPPVIVPPKVNTAKPITPPTRATSTRTTTPTAPPTTATSTRTTTPAAKPTTPAVLQLGKKVRKLKGETSYYPVPVVRQEPVNIVLAQSAVRTQIEINGRFTKTTKHTSPVTRRTYVYHSDDDYTKNVPQDLFDPFDPRNWTHPFSPFNLTTLIVYGQPVSGGPNLLNGDYAEDESTIDDTATVVPSTDPSSSDVDTRC